MGSFSSLWTMRFVHGLPELAGFAPWKTAMRTAVQAAAHPAVKLAL